MVGPARPRTQHVIQSVRQRVNDHLVIYENKTNLRQTWLCRFSVPIQSYEKTWRLVFCDSGSDWCNISVVLIGVYTENISGSDWCIHGKYQRFVLVYTRKISAVLIGVYTENISGFCVKITTFATGRAGCNWIPSQTQ